MIRFSKKLYANAGHLVTDMAWVLRITWQASPTLTAGILVLEVITSLLPAAQALVGRSLINAFTEALSEGSTDSSSIVRWLIILSLLVLANAAGNLLINLFSDLLYNDLSVRIPMLIVEHAGTLDYPCFEDPAFQDVMERAQRNIASHFTQFVTGIFAVSTNILQIASLIAILTLIEPMITPILLLLIVPYTYFLWRLAVARYSNEYSRATKRRWTRYFLGKLTSRGSIAEVKLLDLSSILIKEFRTLLNEFRDQDRSLLSRGFVVGIAFTVVSTVVFLGFYVRLAIRTLAGGATLGDFTVYTTATTRLGSIIERTVRLASQMLEQTLHVSNLRTLLAVRPGDSGHQAEKPFVFRGEIELRNVTFTYPGAKEPSLSNISLHIKPGDTIALVGENGAGKSTLVKLIAHLYDPTEGRILLDGVDLRDISRDSLYSQLSFVLQSFNTYEATVADNIAYGDWRTLLGNRSAVERIAQHARVERMILAMPDGYDTLLGRNFGKYDLSTGQWQKVAVARAFARDSALFILDEPTSNLDARAEYELFSHIRALTRGRTAIIISHRFSTVSMAERIVVLDKGKLIESGTHEDLMTRNGQYATLYNLHQLQLASAWRKSAHADT